MKRGKENHSIDGFNSLDKVCLHFHYLINILLVLWHYKLSVVIGLNIVIFLVNKDMSVFMALTL